jgi:genome maintenance exonuclease 1
MSGLIFDKTYKYPKLERVDSPEGRRYVTPSGLAVPSVTTILDKTKSEEKKQVLENWAKRVGGQQQADAIKNGAAALGTVIHNQLEKYMLGEELVWGNNLIQKLAKKMVEKVIAEGIPNIERVFGLESALYVDNLYAGTADLIVQIDGKLMIADFKNSIKMKKEEYLEDYYTQLVAYSIAHNSMFGTDIDSGRIMMVARPDESTGVCEYKEFDLTPEKFKIYEEKWLSRIEQYYSQN